MEDQIQRKSSDFDKELASMTEALHSMIGSYQKISEDHFLRGLHAEWHLSGLIYHLKNIIANYNRIGEGVLLRLNSTHANAFVMHTPEVRNLMYEFYGFISLARITLDNLKDILYPLFTNRGSMPKSITGIVSRSTNCPVYERIANTDELQYLIDLRNCLVHYRNFATSNVSLIMQEGIDFQDKDDKIAQLTKPMAKGTFRITKNNDVVFNIFIPDIIFDWNNNNKLVPFTYDKRINILAESMRFFRHLLLNYLEAFSINIQTQEKVFTYNKILLENPVEYKKFVF